MRRWLCVLVVASTLVVAGCAGGPGAGTTTTATDGGATVTETTGVATTEGTVGTPAADAETDTATPRPSTSPPPARPTWLNAPDHPNLTALLATSADRLAATESYAWRSNYTAYGADESVIETTSVLLRTNVSTRRISALGWADGDRAPYSTYFVDGTSYVYERGNVRTERRNLSRTRVREGIRKQTRNRLRALADDSLRVVPEDGDHPLVDHWNFTYAGTVTRDGETLYRFTASELTAPVNTYAYVRHAGRNNATLLVDGEGVIRRYAVTADLESAGEWFTSVEYALAIDGVNRTTVSSPGWVPVDARD